MGSSEEIHRPGSSLGGEKEIIERGVWGFKRGWLLARSPLGRVGNVGIVGAGASGWMLKTTLIGGSHLLAVKGKEKKKEKEGGATGCWVIALLGPGVGPVGMPYLVFGFKLFLFYVFGFFDCFINKFARI
jgi:hypothetical protein